MSWPYLVQTPCAWVVRWYSNSLGTQGKGPLKTEQKAVLTPHTPYFYTVKNYTKIKYYCIDYLQDTQDGGIMQDKLQPVRH